MKKIKFLVLLGVLCMWGCLQAQQSTKNKENSMQIPNSETQTPMDTTTQETVITFGAGCFWCVEAVFQQVEGVIRVVSGYSGGKTKNPTYSEICTGKTGHAEVCQVIYNPQKVSFETLLEVFWKTHDPTTLNRQGADVGTQYRSVIFYHHAEQKNIAETYKKKLDEAKIWNNPIVTEIVPFEAFYQAENYHQNYYNDNPNQSYCRIVITPKLEKFKKVFGDKLKKTKE